MFRTRAVRDAAEFTGMPGDSDDFVAWLARTWSSGESRPEWCFLVGDETGTVGRIGFRVVDTVPDPSLLGCLPPKELIAFGLHLPWTGDYLEVGRRLLAEASAAVASEVPDLMEVRINNEVHPHPDARGRLMEACGLTLFQEKQGFVWKDTGDRIEVGDRLAFRTVDDVGTDEYQSVMAPCGEGTLDRNDRYYWDGCGPANWAAVMTTWLAEEDSPMWLVGYRRGEPVGYVAVASVEDWGSTIVHVGVVPEHRGNGYINDLLAAGTAAAQRSGIDGMLSDVDVLNDPMMNAMRRGGHLEGVRPWHVWAYRGRTETIAR